MQRVPVAQIPDHDVLNKNIASRMKPDGNRRAHLTQFRDGQRANLVAKEESAVLHRLEWRITESAFIHDGANFLQEGPTVVWIKQRFTPKTTFDANANQRSGPRLGCQRPKLAPAAPTTTKYDSTLWYKKSSRCCTFGGSITFCTRAISIKLHRQCLRTNKYINGVTRTNKEHVSHFCQVRGLMTQRARSGQAPVTAPIG